MQYISAKDASERWGVSTRSVQMYCNDGMIDGAVRFNRSWMIPVTATKPKGIQTTSSKYIATPLLSATTYFMPGEAYKTLNNLSNPEQMQLKFELDYERGQITNPLEFVNSTPPQSSTRICALLTAAHSAISLGDIESYAKIRQLLLRLEQTNQNNQSVLDTLELTKATLALSMYAPRICPKMIREKQFDSLAEDTKRYALYLYSRYLLYIGKHDSAYEVAYTTLLLKPYEGHSLLDLHLHLLCACASISFDKQEQGIKHLKTALTLAEPDGFIMPFVVYLIPLKGLLEQYSTNYPKDYTDKIIATWRTNWKNWIYMHNRYTKENITAILTAREYRIADMASNGMSNTEIADKMCLSVSSIKSILQVIYQKLYINKRLDLKKYIL